MRICHVGNPDSLAIKVFVDHFSRNGHEVHTFGWGDYKYELNENIRHHDLSFRKEKQKKKQALLLGKDASIIEKKKPFLKTEIFYFIGHLMMKRLIKKIGPDMIHGHEAAGYGWTTTSTKKIPNLLTCWGSDINKFPWESKWIHYKVKRSLDRTNIVHVTNSDFGNTITERFSIPREKIMTIGWGVDVDLFDPKRIDPEKLDSFKGKFGLEEDLFTILYPAGFRDKQLQNYVNLVKAFIHFNKEIPGSRLVLLSYGRNSGLQDIRSLLDKNDLWDRVKIINDFIPLDEMPYLYRSCDVTAVLHDVDQMAASISESILMENVLLLSRIKPYMNRFKDGKSCLFTDQKDPNTIFKNLMDIHENLDSYRKKFIRRNIEDVFKTYSRPAQMKKIEDLYKEAIQIHGKGK